MRRGWGTASSTSTSTGLVKYASPNAVSAVHRMGHVGDVVGEVLAKVVTDLVSRSGATSTSRWPWW